MYLESLLEQRKDFDNPEKYSRTTWWGKVERNVSIGWVDSVLLENKTPILQIEEQNFSQILYLLNLSVSSSSLIRSNPWDQSSSDIL
jgi:hypothetical protein